jgi:acyl-CoA thioesterase I
MKARYCVLFLLATVWLALRSSWTTAAVVQRLEDGEDLRVAAIGTSLTKSLSAVWFDTQLPNWLNTLGPGKATILNNGIAGSASSYGAGATGQPAQSSGLYNQLPTTLAQHPDVVFIEFGMNDAYVPYNLDVTTSKSNLRSMVDQILASGPKTEVVVQTMNNCRPGSVHEQDRPQLVAYYQGYRDAISTYYACNARVVLVDNHPSWVNLYQTNPTLWNAYVPDGIHPLANGTAAITIPNIKAALLAQMVPEPGALTLLGCGLAAWLLASARRKRKESLG